MYNSAIVILWIYIDTIYFVFSCLLFLYVSQKWIKRIDGTCCVWKMRNNF